MDRVPMPVLKDEKETSDKKSRKGVSNVYSLDRGRNRDEKSGTRSLLRVDSDRSADLLNQELHAKKSKPGTFFFRGLKWSEKSGFNKFPGHAWPVVGNQDLYRFSGATPAFNPDNAFPVHRFPSVDQKIFNCRFECFGIA